MRIGDVPLKTAVTRIYIPTFLMPLGHGMIFPALPALALAFDVPGVLAVQVITAHLLGRLVFSLPAGAAVDRWGAKLVMVIGASAAVVSAVSAALAPSFTVIIVSQFVWGAGSTLWQFGREITAVQMVRREQRGRQMSAVIGISSTGMALGPALGGILTDSVGVQSIFIAMAAVALAVLAVSLTMENPPAPAQQRRQFSLFPFKAIKEIHPYLRATYIVLFFGTFAAMLRTQVVNSMLPLHLQEGLAYSATVTGFMFSILAVCAFLMIVPTGFVSDKLGRKWAVAPAALLCGIGFVLIAMAPGLGVISVGLVMVGIGNGLALGSMATYTYDISPPHVRGQLQAMRRTVAELGALSGPPVSGAIATILSPGAAFLVWAPLQFLSAFLLFLVAKETIRGRGADVARSSAQPEAPP